MYLFQAVKEAITARQAAEGYGIKVNRNGMACCPFHPDRTPSMKLDKRFHCFGCQADGDVIDFTAKLFGLRLTEAARKLAQDFGIPYDGNRRPVAPPPIREPTPEEREKEEEDHCFLVLLRYYRKLRQWEEKFRPKQLEDEWHPLFEEAQERRVRVEYLLDELLAGAPEERRAIVVEQRNEVKRLERRLSELAAEETGGRPSGGEWAGSAADAAGNR